MEVRGIEKGVKEEKKMSFSKSVYQLVKQIPKGKVVTYGQVARKIGKPKATRAVGNALHHNPDPKTIPCHRVVNREGRLAPGFGNGGWGVKSAKRTTPLPRESPKATFTGWRKQRKKLLAEGVKFKDQMHVNLTKCQWNF